MRRTYQALITLALGLALVGATTAVAAAAMPPAGTQDQADQRKALYQAEQERTLARHRALGALDAIAAQPAARTDPAAPDPGVNVPATLLVGLVGGLLAVPRPRSAGPPPPAAAGPRPSSAPPAP